MVEHLNKNKKTLHQAIHLSGSQTIDDITIGVECALQYNDSFSENISTFANVINTYDGGAHLTGFRMALNRSLGTGPPHDYTSLAYLLSLACPKQGHATNDFHAVLLKTLRQLFS